MLVIYTVLFLHFLLKRKMNSEPKSLPALSNLLSSNTSIIKKATFLLYILLDFATVLYSFTSFRTILAFSTLPLFLLFIVIDLDISLLIELLKEYVGFILTPFFEKIFVSMAIIVMSIYTYEAFQLKLHRLGSSVVLIGWIGELVCLIYGDGSRFDEKETLTAEEPAF